MARQLDTASQRPLYFTITARISGRWGSVAPVHPAKYYIRLRNESTRIRLGNGWQTKLTRLNELLIIASTGASASAVAARETDYGNRAYDVLFYGRRRQWQDDARMN